MSALEVIAIGPASSVQDRGRFGAQRYGLTPSGAMDVLALATANALAGNAPFAAAIELGPFAATFTARDGAINLALAGAARPAAIDGRPLHWPQSFILKTGETLTIGFARDGAFSYLAPRGGVRGDAMFGSLAVNARAGLGSPFPRPLQAGDRLTLAAADDTPPQGIDLPAITDGPIRVVLGPQDDEFSDAIKALFLGSDWKVAALSDRMGFRLEGPPIKHLHGHNIVSDGTVLGSIQIPGNGAPIVLMPDRGTSGGYPKIATVITADLGRLAQTQAGRQFRFEAVTMRYGAGRITGIFGAVGKLARPHSPSAWHCARSRCPDGRQRRRCCGECNRRAFVANLDRRHNSGRGDMTIDLNCDLGEGFGPWQMGNDAAMIELATSVNIACGFHAGDADTMRATVDLAKARGVAIGAHPGYRDIQGFGRRSMAGMSASEIENLVAYQIGALQAIAAAAGHKVTHVKAHGALSNVACVDDLTAQAIANGIRAVDRSLMFVVLANSKLVAAGDKAGLPLIHEVFADRAYEDDGQLMSRKKPGSVLHDPDAIAARVVKMVQDGAVIAASGKSIKMTMDTVCIHGDTPGAVDIGRKVRSGLEAAGIAVRAFQA